MGASKKSTKKVSSIKNYSSSRKLMSNDNSEIDVTSIDFVIQRNQQILKEIKRDKRRKIKMLLKSSEEQKDDAFIRN
jgi:hypothetical protein